MPERKEYVQKDVVQRGNSWRWDDGWYVLEVGPPGLGEILDGPYYTEDRARMVAQRALLLDDATVRILREIQRGRADVRFQQLRNTATYKRLLFWATINTVLLALLTVMFKFKFDPGWCLLWLICAPQ